MDFFKMQRSEGNKCFKEPDSLRTFLSKSTCIIYNLNYELEVYIWDIDNMQMIKRKLTQTTQQSK